MKNLGLLALFFLSQIALAQTVSFKLDYSAEYLVVKNSDTVAIKIGDNGRYLYSDTPMLATTMGKRFSRGMNLEGNELDDVAVLMDLKTSDFLFSVQSDKIDLTMKANMLDFVDEANFASDQESVALIGQATGNTYTWNGKDYPLYKVFPETEPQEALIMAFLEDYPLDYNSYFGQLFSQVLNTTLTIDLPRGIPLYVEAPNGEVLLKLLNVSKTPLKGNAELNIKLNE